MAITNKEIITNQVRRINEKAHTNVVPKKSNGMWYLCTIEDGAVFPPYPFSYVNTMRTAPQMIEYLAGLEDAVNYYTNNNK